MTIFHSLAGMCLIAVALWLMFFFPYRFNEYFKETYGHKAWSTVAAVLQAICLVFAMFSNDGQNVSCVGIVYSLHIVSNTRYRIALTGHQEDTRHHSHNFYTVFGFSNSSWFQ